jgi:hypothetical protein
VRQMAQMGLVFHPLYRLTVGGVSRNQCLEARELTLPFPLLQLMLVLGGVLCVYGAIYTPNPSCNVSHRPHPQCSTLGTHRDLCGPPDDTGLRYRHRRVADCVRV